MSNIIAPNPMDQLKKQIRDEVAKMPREEKEFVLMLQLHVQPSEADKMEDKKVDWLVARLFFESHNQQQQMQAEYLRQQEMIKAEALRQQLKL